MIPLTTGLVSTDTESSRHHRHCEGDDPVISMAWEATDATGAEEKEEEEEEEEQQEEEGGALASADTQMSTVWMPSPVFTTSTYRPKWRSNGMICRGCNVYAVYAKKCPCQQGTEYDATHWGATPPLTVRSCRGDCNADSAKNDR